MKRVKRRGLLRSSVGDGDSEKALRTALAMGADSATLVRAPVPLAPLSVATALQSVVSELTPDLVLLGLRATDDNCGQVGPMLAGRLGWGQGIGVRAIAPGAGGITVRCESDGGIAQLELTLPAVVTADIMLALPRPIGVANMLRAKKKPLTIIDRADSGDETAPALVARGYAAPPRGRTVQTVSSAANLVDLLRTTTDLLPPSLRAEGRP